MRKLVLLCLLALASCAREVVPKPGETAVHVARGGEPITTRCGMEYLNFQADDRKAVQDYEDMFVISVGADVGIEPEDTCTFLKGWKVMLVDADDHGSFKAGKVWVDGATACDVKMAFVGLGPSHLNSALAHELVHVVECGVMGTSPMNGHLGWQEMGLCKVIEGMSNRPDGCDKD